MHGWAGAAFRGVRIVAKERARERSGTVVATTSGAENRKRRAKGSRARRSRAKLSTAGGTRMVVMAGWEQAGVLLGSEG